MWTILFWLLSLWTTRIYVPRRHLCNSSILNVCIYAELKRPPMYQHQHKERVSERERERKSKCCQQTPVEMVASQKCSLQKVCSTQEIIKLNKSRWLFFFSQCVGATIFCGLPTEKEMCAGEKIYLLFFSVIPLQKKSLLTQCQRMERNKTHYQHLTFLCLSKKKACLLPHRFCAHFSRALLIFHMMSKIIRPKVTYWLEFELFAAKIMLGVSSRLPSSLSTLLFLLSFSLSHTLLSFYHC